MRISDWSSDVCSSDLGGKISSYRHVALHAVDELAAHVAALTGKRWTGRTPLPGGDFPVRGLAALIADIRLCHPFLPRATVAEEGLVGNRIVRTTLFTWCGASIEKKSQNLLNHN